MNVELLAKIVSELILDRDELRLPGLGVFVAELEPASFSDRGYILNPPYRRLRFEQKSSDDNSVVKAYASGNGIGEDKAAQLLEKFGSELKETILQEGTAALPGLGKFCAGRGGRILFVADENLDIPYDGIKLEPISLKAHNEEPTFKEVFADIPSLEEPEPVQAPRPEDSVPEEPTPVPAVTEPVAAESVAAEEPTPAPVPAEPEPEPVPAVEEPEPAPVPVPAVEMPAPTPGQLSGHGKQWWKIPVIVLVVAIVAVAVFITVAQIAPDLIDSILYTSEELLIINS